MKTIFKLLPLIAVLGLSSCNNSKTETNNNESINNNETTNKDEGSKKEENENQEIFDGIILENDGNYTINDAKGLVNFKDVIKGKIAIDKNHKIVNKTYFANKTVKLGANIDLTSIIWDPIDTIDGVTNGLVFDGNGHTISNMYITGDNSQNHDTNIKYTTTVFTDEQALGFFGFMGSNTIIKNVTFDSANIEAYEGKWVGTVFGYMPYKTVTLENIKVTNTTITSSEGKKVGGLIGMVKFEENASITVKNCEVSDSIFKGKSLVSGIAGQLYKYQADYKTSNLWKVEGCGLKNNTFIAKTDSKNTLSPLSSDDPELDFDSTSELFVSLGNTEENNNYQYNQNY